MSVRIAAVQMDCSLGRTADNLDVIRRRLKEAVDGGAKIIVFPECILSGYGHPDRTAVLDIAEPIPGPSTSAIADDCRRYGVAAVFGLMETDPIAGTVHNSAAIVKPDGSVATYRKIHLPCVGADRFVDPGDRPFEVHELFGLKMGVGICFDSSFPESARIMTLLGADLVVLPTNWAGQALKMAQLVSRVRAFENHIYYVCVNRVGDETGYHYIGHSSICDFNGDFMQYADHDRETILFADIDPVAARQKKIVHCVGEYEIDRVNWRRPEMYGMLLERYQPVEPAPVAVARKDDNEDDDFDGNLD